MFRQMGIVIYKIIGKFALIIEKFADTGIITVGQFGHILTKEFPHQQAADNTAMGKNCNGTAVIIPGRIHNTLIKPLAVLVKSFCAIDLPLRGVLIKKMHLVRILMMQPAIGLILPWTAIDLPEPVIPLQFQALRHINRTGRQTSAGQTAGIAGINTDIFKPLFHAFYLPHTARGQKAIIKTVQPAENITFRFTMSNQINFSHRISSQNRGIPG